MKTKAGFFGVYPTVYALFDDQGNLARDPMRRQVQSLLEHKVHGIGVLGLASEVNKLSTAERRQLMEWVAEDVDGKVPLTVTIAEASVSGQIEFVRAAAAVGAKCAISQPPPVKHVPESELIRFFGAVADASPIPIIEGQGFTPMIVARAASKGRVWIQSRLRRSTSLRYSIEATSLPPPSLEAD